MKLGQLVNKMGFVQTGVVGTVYCKKMITSLVIGEKLMDTNFHKFSNICS